MDLSQALLFFFSALGAFNGLLFAGYFLCVAKPPTAARRLFGAFLLMLSIRVGKSVFFFFNHDLAREYLQLGLSACLLIGPLLYFFVRAQEQTDRREPPRGFWTHFCGWLSLALIGGMLYPYGDYPEYWNPYVVRGIYFVWFAYTVAAIVAAWPRFQRYFGRNGANREDTVVVWVTLSALVLVVAYAMVRYTSYITGALAFSLLLYSSWAAVTLFQGKKTSSDAEALGTPDRQPLLGTDQARTLRHHLERAMRDDRLYINPNLKLADLAAAVGCTTHQLSELLNNVVGQKFHHYVNDRRIALAKELIEREDHLTLEAIGLSCGFNARSTFYKAFKKSTGTTPAKYRERYAIND